MPNTIVTTELFDPEVPTQRGPRPGRPRVVVTWSGGSVEHELPSSGSLLIGRGLEADLRIGHASVSRCHARIEVEDDVRIHDLGSANGTWVDGRRLEMGTSVVVRPGALVELGHALLVVAQAEPKRTAPRSAAVIVEDPEMAQVHELVALVARSTLSVILLGETGVGKEVLATAVHELSPRRDKPFCKVNCAALVETLLEAELFGHERGAFTGAVASKAGLLESAQGGTVFLDELGEMPLSTQAKLLRALESGEVTRVGGLKPRPIDVRFVAATNRDLWELVAQGRFRQDLFFRLDGMSIRIPPLRERQSELGSLARSFLDAACDTADRPRLELPEDTLDVLRGHYWLGNVRELRNVIKRAALLCTGDALRPEHLRFDALGKGTTTPARTIAPPPVSPSTPTVMLPQANRMSKRETQRREIIDALNECAGNQTRAARLIGVSRRTLLKRIDALDLPRPRKRHGDPLAKTETCEVAIAGLEGDEAASSAA